MYLSYIKLASAALLPVIMAALVYLCEKKTKFGQADYKARQIAIGIIFGLLAIIGTEWGIPMNGAMVNCRDSAVLTAGLLFGSPAGIIAGLIGGLERWFCVLWHADGSMEFTRLACSLSTIIAGFYSAALRKYMFENKKPGWALAFAVGLVIETFHLTMVFILRMSDPIKAVAVVKACTIPMLLANSLSILLATMVVEILAKEKLGFKYDKLKISQTIQRWLLVTVSLAFITTSYFVFRLQTRIADVQTENSLSSSLESVSLDINDASDRNMIEITRDVAEEIRSKNMSVAELEKIAEEYKVAEINLVGKDGIIVSSNIKSYIGFDMSSGSQAEEFLCLLKENGTESFSQKYTENEKGIHMKYAGVKTDYGFIQVGYDGYLFRRQIDEQVKGITQNRHAGRTGYILIFDMEHGVVSKPLENDMGETFSEEGIDTYMDTLKPAEDSVFRMNVSSGDCFCKYITIEGYYVLAAIPQAEALQMRNISLYVNSFLEILVFAAMFGMIYLLIKRVVVNQISDINHSLAKITGGDLDEMVNVRTSEEFASLSDDINLTVSALKNYIDEASARIDKELEFARDIQRSVLPSVYPAFSDRDEFEIFALMDTAKEVGGDFYDFYFTHKHKLNFLVADVSGKGIPAAMFMMRAKTELKRYTEADLSTGEVFTRSNAALCEGNDAGMFVTAWQGGIDLKTGSVEFANAGHNPPLVRKADGKFKYLRSRPGFILAGMEGIKYKDQYLNLEKGDTIYLYTDGVTEATNKNEELYGEDRLLEAINSKEFESMEELCRFIRKDVEDFVSGADQFDDITMVALRYKGYEE